jgi:protein-arginine kinase activator protein McsA
MSECPFSGESCPNDKHFEVTDMQNGKTNHYHVCDECISKVKTGAMGDIASFINSILSIPNPPPPPKKTCPDCGWTSRDMVSSGGKAGCAKCYDYFEDEFEAVFKQCQHSTTHIGKKLPPKPPHRELMMEVLFKKYNSQLDKAVQKEDYRSAADLKKEILELHIYKKRRKTIIRNLQYALENGESIEVVDFAKDELNILYKEIEAKYFSSDSR